MFKNYLLRLKACYFQAMREQKGQSIIIITFAFLGLIAMLGLALDLGMVYIEQVRVSRTADAAALAAVVELPFEEEAMRRAIEFVELNGYHVNGPDADTQILVRGCIESGGNLRNVDTGGVLDPAISPIITPTNTIAGFSYVNNVSNPRATFVIDTLAYQPSDASTVNQDNCTGVSGQSSALYGTATKLRVSGEVNVNMNFMQFFGFGDVPVQDYAVGENVTNLDVVVVFDVSGSMNFETTCFGCWVEDHSKDVIEYPFPLNGYYKPLPDATTHDVCTDPPDPVESGGYHYMVHEAELYSRDVPLHGWEFERRIPGQGFWVLQRYVNNNASILYDSPGAYIRPHPLTTYSQSSVSNYPQLQGAAYNNECFDGPNLSGQCWKSTADSLGETSPLSTPPWVEYDFSTKDWPNISNSLTHIWIRAQGGGSYAFTWNGVNPSNLYSWRKSVYWQVGRSDIGWNNVQGGTFDRLDDDGYSGIRRPNNNKWRWLKLGSAYTPRNVQRTLRLYQGSTGFYVDKIIFTDDPTGGVGQAIDRGGNVYGSGTVSNNFRNLVGLNSDKGPPATDGSATREACNMCNPEFGLTVAPADCSCSDGVGGGCTEVITTTNQLSNHLYHDVDPLRSAQEAVKNFAKRLDPRFDQIGLVSYSTNATSSSYPRHKLDCLRWAGKYDADGVRGCFDPSTNPITYTEVIRTVEDAEPTSSTNISEGMKEGLEELGIEAGSNTGVDSTCSKTGRNDKHSCDRRGAARRVLVLMTDGSPNQDDNCGVSMWNGNFGQGNEAYDCSIFYAREAANNNVTVYTIGIGSGVNVDLLTAMATGQDPGTGDIYFESRGGEYYPAATPTDLDIIFDAILSNVFVRIVN